MANNNSWVQLAVWFGVFIAFFYVFLILPNKKKEKKHVEMVNSLRKGDKVVTIGGIRGEISKVKEDSLVVKVNDSTEIEFIKKAIGYKVEE